MRTFRISIGLSMLVFCLALIDACQSQAPAAPPAPPEPTYLPTATIKDLMLSIVDPSADGVWLSGTSSVDGEGVGETVGKSEGGWGSVRGGGWGVLGPPVPPTSGRQLGPAASRSP